MARRRITIDTARGEDRWQLPTLTVEEVLALPVSMDMVLAARALGLSRTVAYRMCREGALRFGGAEVPVAVVSNTYRVRRADLLTALGVKDPAQAPTEVSA